MYISVVVHNACRIIARVVASKQDPAPGTAGPPGVRPIEVNAGGIVPPDQLVGRESQIAQLIRLAAPPADGAILLGDRRIGKTSLLRAIEQPLREAGHLVVRVSAETSSLAEFGAALARGLRAHRSAANWGLDLEGDFEVNVGITKIALRTKGHRAAPTEEDLFSACAQAARRQGEHVRVIFLLDEITVLATDLARRSPDEAREFLHSLRRARQEIPAVAMFLAGSIGLHHALPDKSEVNDLVELHVDVLAPEDATLLAEGLIVGAGLPVTDLPGVAAEMVAQTSGFPFYLHGLAQELAQRPGPIRPAEVRETFQAALDRDLWDASHYEARLDSYYGPAAPAVRALLDTISTAPGPMPVEALLEAGAVAPHGLTRDQLLDLLRRLEADHYLRRVGRSSEMANDLVARIWRHLRRL